MKRFFIFILSIISGISYITAQNAKTMKMPKTAKETIPELINKYEFNAAAKELQSAIILKTKKKQPVTEDNILLNKARKGASMLAATQNICIIDSVILSKNDFLKGIKLNKESGTITPYNDFFNTTTQPDSYVFTNGLGNKCYYSQRDSSGHLAIYTSDKLAGKWSDAEKVNGLEDINDDINYPFMMADGTTLYFAAKGSESIGGYDIFVTRYDAENTKFLKPENLGMPFNSPANDYMYAENDIDSIGWFVSDRNQKAGNVCVYIFIPSETRKLYDSKVYNEAQIKRFARIESIKNTWTGIADRNAYLEKYNEMVAIDNKRKHKNAFEFVINDNITYYKLSDFKSPTDKEQFTSLQEMQNKYAQEEKNLENMRDKYHNSDDATRGNMRSNILEAEKAIEKMNNDIHVLEKSIRNTENILLNK